MRQADPKSGKVGHPDLDVAREKSTAYEYLCRLEEAKTWISECIQEELPPASEFEKTLSNGVYLAKIAHFCAPHLVQYEKIFDSTQEKWKNSGLHFKHTENINHFLKAITDIRLPEIFRPETTDIFERKNMPRVIFCLHALSLIMFKLGSAPKIQDLIGRVQFSEEEISVMQDELERTGVNMPQFGKLGGMLYDGGGGGDSRGSSIDQHFARLGGVLRSRDANLLLQFLRDPMSQIHRVEADNIRQYMLLLNSESKNLTRNLTQAEVQGMVYRTNLLVALEAVKTEVLSEDTIALLRALRNPALDLANMIVNSNVEMYLTNLMDCVENMDEHELLKKATIYEAVAMANQLENERNTLDVAIMEVNAALRSQDACNIISALQHEALHIPQVYPEAAELYFASLKLIQEGTEADLNYEGIYKPVCFLNLVAEASLAARKGDRWRVKMCLQNPELFLKDVEKNCLEEYVDDVIRRSRACEELLSHGDLQDIIEAINEENSNQLTIIHGVERVNYSVDHNGIGLAEAMLTLGFKVSRNDELRLLSELMHTRDNKSRIEETEMQLWLEDIHQAYNTVQELKVEALSVAGALSGINRAVEFGDVNGVVSYLFNNWQLFRLNTRPERQDGERILKGLERKLLNRRNAPHSWVIHFFQDESNVYIDVENGSLSWTPPPKFIGEGAALSVMEICQVVDDVTGGHGQMLEDMIIRLQARIRGFLERQRFFGILDWYDRNTHLIIKIQALWRGRMARKLVMKELENGIRERTKALQFLGNLVDIKRAEHCATVIQRAWRGYKLKTNWQRIIESGTADLATVVKHIHLIDIKAKDAQEELDLARLRGELTQLLRKNEKLEEEVEAMDKKIGLLVQNRISVQEVISDKKKGLTLHRNRSESGSHHSTTGTSRGFKALVKESQDRLKAYQQMFYLLQTDPNYIARLLFVSPLPKPKFLEILIFTLYNFGGNRREEYLILKLFSTALRHEIATRVTSLDEIVKTTPLVLKFVVNYNRYHRNHTLKRLLSPVIQQVLDDKHLKINTQAVDVYKNWISQLESETGKQAGLPYDVSTEQALKYEEVHKRLDRSMTSLKRCVKLFLATIIKSKLPYSILYISKVLYSSLSEKFPEAKEKELLKVVGNLIYFKYMNPVIISPDRFDMLDKKDTTLTSEQRRNLAHVAKLLQYSSSKIGFGAENPHMESLNDFIIECHEKLKVFFSQCCNVVEPEAEYNIDQYSDAALIAKPNIIVSLDEICDTHSLLIDHKDTVIPSPGDPMHGILKTLGAASLSSLHGAAKEDCGSLAALGRTEVCLVLNPVSGAQLGNDMSDTDRLWVKTKHLLMAILPAVHTSDKQTLIGLLKSRTTQDQEYNYNKILDAKEQEDEASRHKDLEVFDIFCDDEGRLPLEDAKRLVLKNLRILEVKGYTRSKDGCQTIINDIARDIFNQREHRINRKKDTSKLRRNKADLIKKQNYMLEQLENYRQYTLQCLANLNRAGNSKRVHFSSLQDESTAKGRKVRNKSAVKYSATKLFDKGVLYTIEGLPPSNFKNVQFIFVPLEEDGRFKVSARFMGVDMESVVIDIQDLLKLQYEGVSVTDMFGKAKINVNLLLYFLNSKFYGR